MSTPGSIISAGDKDVLRDFLGQIESMTYEELKQIREQNAFQRIAPVGDMSDQVENLVNQLREIPGLSALEDIKTQGGLQEAKRLVDQKYAEKEKIYNEDMATINNLISQLDPSKRDPTRPYDINGTIGNVIRDQSVFKSTTVPQEKKDELSKAHLNYLKLGLASSISLDDMKRYNKCLQMMREHSSTGLQKEIQEFQALAKSRISTAREELLGSLPAASTSAAPLSSGPAAAQPAAVASASAAAATSGPSASAPAGAPSGSAAAAQSLAPPTSPPLSASEQAKLISEAENKLSSLLNDFVLHKDHVERRSYTDEHKKATEIFISLLKAGVSKELMENYIVTHLANLGTIVFESSKASGESSSNASSLQHAFVKTEKEHLMQLAVGLQNLALAGAAASGSAAALASAAVQHNSGDFSQRLGAVSGLAASAAQTGQEASQQVPVMRPQQLLQQASAQIRSAPALNTPAAPGQQQLTIKGMHDRIMALGHSTVTPFETTRQGNDSLNIVTKITTASSIIQVPLARMSLASSGAMQSSFTGRSTFDQITDSNDQNKIIKQWAAATLAASGENKLNFSWDKGSEAQILQYHKVLKEFAAENNVAIEYSGKAKDIVNAQPLTPSTNNEPNLTTPARPGAGA